MTVAELIEKLKQFPPDLNVEIETGVGMGGDRCDPTDVELDDGSVLIFEKHELYRN